MTRPMGFRDLKVYQLAYELAMEIFRESKSFPPEEKYSLTDQIRRSSRSVAANIAEGYRKKQYLKNVREQDGRRRWRSNGNTSMAGFRA